MPQLPAYALAVPFALGLFSIPKRAGSAPRRALRAILLGGPLWSTALAGEPATSAIRRLTSRSFTRYR
jgi:hypothetical protein